MIISEGEINDLTLGIRLRIQQIDANSFHCKVKRMDPYRKILFIGLPKGHTDKWVIGIASVLRSMWTASLSCVLAIDYENWVSLLQPDDVKKLEDLLPKSNFCIRVYSVPQNSSLNTSAQMCEFVKELYDKKRRKSSKRLELEMG